MIAAVDPGLTGAIAILDDDEPALLDAFDMPTAGGSVSPVLLARDLRGWGIDVVIVEKVGSMPDQGVSSTFKFGCAYGVVLGVIGACGFRVEHVTPGQWKSALGLNKRSGEKVAAHKDRSRLKALELWPGSSSLFQRKKDSGRAEAALIGWWWMTRRSET